MAANVAGCCCPSTSMMKGVGFQRANVSTPEYQNAASPTRRFNAGRTRSTMAASTPIPAINKKYRRSPVRSIVAQPAWIRIRSEEHTSELQSHHDLVCRLLLEKKK